MVFRCLSVITRFYGLSKPSKKKLKIVSLLFSCKFCVKYNPEVIKRRL